MKHHTPNAPRPPPQGETIPKHLNNIHKLKPPKNDGVSSTSLQGAATIFLFNTLSIILPCTWVRPTPKSARVTAEEDL